jgi:hypothetical protein
MKAGHYTFSLRFPLSRLDQWIARYDKSLDARIENVISPRARTAGYFTKSDFLEINRWKTPRTAKRVAENSEEYIKIVTQTALSTPSERLRIEILTLLRGMGWRTSSVILHFAHKEPYPILDFRSLWSLGIEVAEDKYNFDLWQPYTAFCRDLASQAKKTMRELDRGLWQYSKENQR